MYSITLVINEIESMRKKTNNALTVYMTPDFYYKCRNDCLRYEKTMSSVFRQFFTEDTLLDVPVYKVNSQKNLHQEFVVCQMEITEENQKIGLEQIDWIIKEWNRGCSNTVGKHPIDCNECTINAINAIKDIVQQRRA